MKGTVYLSGPIRGNPTCYVDFAWWERHVGVMSPDVSVVNPIQLNKLVDAEHGGEPATTADYLRNDLLHLLECNQILMLPHWQSSRGACLERKVSKMCGIEVLYWNDLIPDLVPERRVVVA